MEQTLESQGFTLNRSKIKYSGNLLNGGLESQVL